MSAASAPRGPFLRFLVTGGVFACLFAVLSSALAVRGGIPPLAAALATQILCIPPAYQCQRRFAFRVGTARRGAFASYAAMQVAGMGAVSLATTRLVTGQYWADAAVMLATSALVAMLNYAVARAWTFAPRRLTATCANGR